MRTFVISALITLIVAGASFASTSVMSFNTEAGEFKLYISFGKYSTTEGEEDFGGLQRQVLEFPNGEQRPGFPDPRNGLDMILDIASFGGKTFIITRSSIHEYRDGQLKEVFGDGLHHSEKFSNRAAGFDFGDFGDTRYYQVYAQRGYDFGGLVAYVDGEWKLYRYEGQPRFDWMQSWQPHFENYTLTMNDERELYFNTETGKFWFF